MWYKDSTENECPRGRSAVPIPRTVNFFLSTLNCKEKTLQNGLSDSLCAMKQRGHPPRHGLVALIY